MAAVDGQAAGAGRRRRSDQGVDEEALELLAEAKASKS
jgi:hypothetical protein